MTKVQRNCLEVAKKTGNKLLAVKLALLANIENDGDVYLPNAQGAVEGFVSKQEFAGFLSVLQKEGFYTSYSDNFFGRVNKN